MTKTSAGALSDLPAVLTMAEVQQFLRVSKPAAYALVQQAPFPVVRIGRTIRIDREGFLKWLQASGDDGQAC